jgi:hypothetical protein
MFTARSQAEGRARYALAAAAVGCALASVSASAQTSFASGSEIVIPTVANISVYHSSVFVRNPNAGPITLDVRYYQSNQGTAPAGLRACAQLTVQANQSSNFDLGAQCGLNGTDDDFGMLILEDSAGTDPFLAYSRTQTADGIGFSVEGFPTTNFSGAAADVLGLQKVAAAPNYRSNCFVGSLGQAVNWQVQLVQSGSETILGSVSGSLAPFENARILDVFTAAGLVGDFSNVRARFSTPDSPAPAFVGFCTLETSSNGSADFRVAKSTDEPPSSGGGVGTLAATFNGDVQSLIVNTGVFEFLSSTSVPFAATTTISVYAGGWFAKTSTGLGSVDMGVCYQDQNGPGPVTLLGSTTSFTVTGASTFHSVSTSGSLPPATYLIGLCAQNTGSNSVNKNGTSSGYLFTMP